jgi:hypothetical protein
MDIELSANAVEFGLIARKALGSAGGDQLIEQAEAHPAGREALVAPVLAKLGAWDIVPRGSQDELEAAAALCRSVGYWGAPYPIAERLARPRDLEADALIVVADIAPAGPVAGLDLRCVAVTLDGMRSFATPRAVDASARSSAFVVPLDLTPLDANGIADAPLGLVLSSWTLLGMLDRAIELTSAYVKDREQFGQPLASFQSVQFQLTDAEVERVGLEELAKYALWTGELADALALRLAAVEAAEIVFRVAHQLHGATGFCDETTVSWLSRYSQPLRRLPLGLSATRDALTRTIGRHGLTGLFA